jgi:uroporphyrinogen decarboxylase
MATKSDTKRAFRREELLAWRQNERLLPRQRVLAAINHRETDRVPIDFWAVGEIRDRLIQYYKLPDEEALLKLIGVDVRVIRGPSYVGLEMHTYPDGTVEDLWGVRRRRVTFGEGDKKGSYLELASSPLANARNAKDIDNYPGWPSLEWWDYSKISEECSRYMGYAIIFSGDRLDRTAQLKTAMYLRGVEQIMADLVKNPTIVECMLEHINAYYLEYNRRVFEAAGGLIDIFMMGDDFGTQKGPMISLPMWQRFFEKGFCDFIALAHQYGLKVMHHTCGGVRPLIPLFIHAGLDILQSLQPRAAGMDLAGLKHDFGDHLAFHGSVDIQKTLPFGTTDDVIDESRQRLEAGKPGGGFIICTAHNIQVDVPLENVLALIAGYQTYSWYGSSTTPTR